MCIKRRKYRQKKALEGLGVGWPKTGPAAQWLEDFLRFLFFPQMSPVSFAVSGFTIFLLPTFRLRRFSVRTRRALVS